MKYEGEFGRGTHLGLQLPPLVTEMLPVDGLVPVPLHSRRQRERGFNQSMLLASAIASTDLPVVAAALERSRMTDQQVGLDEDSRWENVREAFGVRRGQEHVVRGKRLVLVDDVVTTGATLSSCADALHRGGAAWIGAVTLAR